MAGNDNSGLAFTVGGLLVAVVVMVLIFGHRGNNLGNIEPAAGVKLSITAPNK